MSNPFAIQGINSFSKPVQGIDAIGARGAQGAGRSGGSSATSFGGGQTAYQRDMADFQASIQNWKGAPNLNMPGDPTLNFYS